MNSDVGRVSMREWLTTPLGHSPKRMSLKLKAASICALLVFAAAACGTSDTSSRTSGELHYTMGVGPPTMDPDLLSSTIFNTFLYPVYDSLLWTDVRGDIKPMLAEEYKVAADGLSVEFWLVEDAKFSDGKPFDAAAVVANIERSQTVAGSITAKSLSIVTKVTALDEHRVRMDLDSPASGPLIAALASNAGMMISPAALDNPDLDVNPVGAGQFKVLENVQDQHIKYEAVDGYWDETVPELAALTISFTPDDEARLNRVIDGEVDVAFLRPWQGEAAEKAGLNIEDSTATLTTYSLFLNTARSKFGDVRVRRAMEHAINKQVIADDLYSGWCKPTTQYLASFYWAASKDLKPIEYEYDPDQSKALLKEAGLEKGFEFVMAVETLPIYVKMAEIIQQDLAAVGIKMTIQTMDSVVAQEQYQKGDKYDATLAVLSPPADPSALVESLFLESSPWNPGNWAPESISELAQKGLEAGEPADRAQYYAQIMKESVDNVYPGIQMCNDTVPYVYRDGIEGLALSVDGTRKFRGVSIAN